MAKKNRADRADEALDVVTVAEWDERLIRIGHAWVRAYANRELQAAIEGITTPPPPPPSPPKMGSRRKTESASEEASGPSQGSRGVGNVTSLVAAYRTDGRSPYQGIRHSTRIHYDGLLRRIDGELGDTPLSELKEADFQNLYDGLCADGKAAMGRALITMFRGLANFGRTALEDAECARLSMVLHRMHFSTLQQRTERLTTEQANAIRAAARRQGKPSVALAQALQFDLGLRQKDAIGEWVPIESEPQDESDVKEGDKKWLRGLRWENIDANLILRHVTSSAGNKIAFDLRGAPMVMEELALTYGMELTMFARSKLPLTGPVIVCESTLRPWIADEYRRHWRKAADAAGVPRTVKNMDSRARVPRDREPGYHSAETDKDRPEGPMH